MRRCVSALIVLLVAAALGCGSGKEGSPTAPSGPPDGPPLSIVALGDSLTFGVAATRPYPEVLNTLLRPVYTKGPLTVVNAGQPGELASAGAERVRGSWQPAVKIILLMEGVNDLNARVNNPGDPNDLSTALVALTTMVRTTKAAGLVVALATLPPQRPGWLLLSGRPAASPALLDALNQGIRGIAATEGVHLADVAAAFGGNLSLISGDGVHPTQAGYELLAQTFFQVLRPIVSSF